jgi:hypothetical protein
MALPLSGTISLMTWRVEHRRIHCRRLKDQDWAQRLVLATSRDVPLKVAEKSPKEFLDRFFSTLLGRFMSMHAKVLAKMRSNPQDWRIDDLLSVAACYGFEVRNNGGSHYVFSHPLIVQSLSVPARRPIKPVYVRHFVALIDQLEEPPP